MGSIEHGHGAWAAGFREWGLQMFTAQLGGRRLRGFVIVSLFQRLDDQPWEGVNTFTDSHNLVLIFNP